MSSIDATVGLARLIQHPTFSQIATSILVILVIRLCARAVYRVYFSPLSKFPGSKLDAATRIPQLWAVVKGTPHIRLEKLHQKYGEVVRTAPDELSFIGADAWRDVHGHGTRNTPGSVPHKHWVRYGNTVNGAKSLIIAPDGDHYRMRRIFNPAFADRALKQQEPLFMKYVDLLVQKLREGIEKDPQRKFNMVRMYNFTTFDVMGDLTFGEPLHMLSEGEYDPWVKTIFAFIKFGTRLSIINNYPLLYKPFRALVPESFAKKRVEHFNFSAQRVAKRLEKGRDAEGVDLWDLVLGQPEGKGLSRPEMDANASLFMAAGTETTATLLSGLTFLLLKNPKAMQKLTKEIRHTFPGSEEMSFEKLAALPYLAACIKEAFRLYPPVVLGLPRITPRDGSTICGHFVPPRTTVTVPQRAMYTSESNFKEPHSFLPERWLGEEQFDSDKKTALQPFSVGSRDCVGKNMAYHEMRLIITKVLKNFDLELCPESKTWDDQRVFTLWEKLPLMCTLRAVD